MIRKAKPGDENAIHALIIELAVYEKEPDAVVNSVEALGRHLFEEQVCHAFVAEYNGVVVGFALYYMSYSTWKGKCLYLEDFYVSANCRNQGFGSKLFEAVIQEAKDLKVRRMDWQVLDWNTPAIDFYKFKHAELDATWINGRYHFEIDA
jgi:GNAT superfamily N-acetyltransferase